MSTKVPAPAPIIVTNNKQKAHTEETKPLDVNMLTATVIAFFAVLTILTVLYNAMYKKDGDTVIHSLLLIAVSLYLIQSAFVHYVFMDISNLVYFIIKTPFAQDHLKTIGIQVESFSSSAKHHAHSL